MGKKVYATVGSDERVRAVEGLGAVQGINYRSQDYVEEVKKATDGKGVDVVLDMVAGDYINRNRSEEHTSELQSLMRISYAVFCLKKKNTRKCITTYTSSNYRSYTMYTKQ